MSRRKQSNPKPAKRETEDFDQVVSELKLPLDRVYLRKFGEECLVLAKEHLEAGTVLGTYKCDVKEESSLEDDDKNILKVSRSDNGAPSQVMIDNEGHWLKLMRTAIIPTDANICLRISGGELVCRVTKDVNKEVELKVTCRIDDHSTKFDRVYTEVPRENSPLRESGQEDSDFKDLEDRGMSPKVSPSPIQKVMLDSHSERILDRSADMEFKTSASVDRESSDAKKLRTEYSGDESDCDLNDAQIDVSTSPLHGSPSSGERHDERTNSLSHRGSSKATESEASPNSRTQEEDERVYRCSSCSFQSIDKFLIEKHVHSHRNQPVKKASSNLTNAKSFCDACKIQFMSIDTYQVHKQFYCKSRHEKDETFMPSAMLESKRDISANAIKPGPETVIIRSGVNGGLTSSMIQPQAIYAAISTNPLILLPCSLVNGQRLVPHSSVGGSGIVLQSGIACPAIVEKPSPAKVKEEGPPSRKTSHPIMNFSAESSDRSLNGTSLLRKRKMSEGDVLNLKKSCNNEIVDVEMPEKDPEPAFADPDAPLDLSLKKKCQFTPKVSVPKRKNSIVSTGCPSPSYPNTSDSGSPPRTSMLHSRMTISPCSYSNESLPCYTGTVSVPVPRISKGMAERLSPLSSVIQTDTAGDKTVGRSDMLPPKLLKQGNNICEECQIVFYKYDNYLAHKKHYCAYRRRQLSAIAAAAAASTNQDHSSDDNNSNHSAQNKPNYHSDESANAGIRRLEHPVEQFRSVITKSSQSVFCCDSCGVKFSTSDNLNAHQTYYCIKRADSAMSKVSTGRGDGSDSPKSLESPFAGPEEWKCNYCDATCSSYDTIRRHLLTHSELRGFRCIVCGYKGNTLRGMRSHACEHLTEGSTSIEEFVSSNVVAENGMIPIMPPMNHSDDDSDHSRDSKRERSFSDGTKDRSVLRKEGNPETNELSSSPGITDSPRRDPVPTLSSPIKSESGDSGNADMNGNSQQDSVNPMAFCDVVIKTENEQTSSGEDSSHEERSGSFIKFEPEPEYDSEDKPSDLSKSPRSHVTSVIRRASEPEKVNSDRFMTFQATKKSRSHSKPESELKYCKSCDISFSHLSNFQAHKKYYCVSRVIQNCHQETATVQ